MRRLVGLACLILVFAANSFADVPKTINYQGRLTDLNGNPMPDGIYAVTTTLYNTLTGGSNLWSDNYSVQTKNGYFNLILGSNVARPLNLDFNQQYYLGIAVSPDSEMTPRQPLNSTPYAMGITDASITSAKMKPTWSDKRTNTTYNLTGTTPVTIAGLTTTITAYTPSILFLVGNILGSITNPSNTGIVAYLEVDGSRVTEYSFFDATFNVDSPNTNIPMNAIVPVSAGIHTITIKSSLELDGYTGDILRGQLSVLVFSQ
jgi:hypothetical protein